MTTFTSIVSGNWTNSLTWDQLLSYPHAGDIAIIANTHTVTLDTAAQSCTALTVNAGGVLTDATNNVGLTVSGETAVAGVLTCGTAAMSFGSGLTTSYALTIQSGATFNGGSGNHTVGTLNLADAALNCTLTSGVMTIDSAYSNTTFIISDHNTFSHGNGTVKFTRVGTQTIAHYHPGDDVTFYNLIIGTGVTATTFRQYPSQKCNIVTTNLTIDADATYDTSDPIFGLSTNLTVSGDMTAAGTYVPNDSTTHFNKVGTSTFSVDGTPELLKLTCSGSTQVNISEDIGILDNGELTPATGGSFVPASGKSITFA